MELIIPWFDRVGMHKSVCEVLHANKNLFVVLNTFDLKSGNGKYAIVTDLGKKIKTVTSMSKAIEYVS